MTYESPQNIFSSQFLEGFDAIFVVVALVLFISIFVLFFISLWKIFVKAGQKGWKAIIPVYDIYILFKVWSNIRNFWIFACVYIVSMFISSFSGYIDNLVLFLLLNFLGMICTIASLIITIFLCNNISKSFGHGKCFTAGLVLLSFIFFPILAFGPSKFKKN